MGERWFGSHVQNQWTARRQAPDGRKLRLSVEVLPSGAWDWMVWPEGFGRVCRSGVSATRAEAIAAAEAVARSLTGSHDCCEAAD